MTTDKDGRCRCCSWTGLSVASSIDVDAPCNAVWEQLSNIEASPTILRSVLFVEQRGNRSRADGGGIPFRVGTTWREKRINHGMEYYIIKTITSLEEHSVSMSVSLSEMGWFIRDAVNTCTMTVEPNTESKSRLTCSFALSHANCLAKAFYASCGQGLFRKRALHGMNSDMEDYAAASKSTQAQEG